MSSQDEYNAGPFTDVAAVWGRRLWTFLNEAKIARQMMNASDAGRPAAESIASEIYVRFGEDMKQDRVKQFVGFLIRQVMEQNGYQHLSYNVQTEENPVFSKASTYSSRGK